MERQPGLDYAQNYDVITKWLADALRGETLEVLGVQSGRIEEVFGFEPVDVPVNVDRVDVMLRDDAGRLFHLEEQRNLRRDDLYRCASYHFHAARQWGPGVTDLILASGDVMAGVPLIETQSGRYAPRVIDFTSRDGAQRLREMRAALETGTPPQWLELVFVPLYGKLTSAARGVLVEQVLTFERELYRDGRISAQLLAATLIMSNKFIAKERLQAFWEDIKMLDVIELALEKGLQEGKTLGLQEGKTLGLQEGKTLGSVEMARELLFDALLEMFPVLPIPLAEQLHRIQNADALKGLHRQALKCRDLQAFATLVQQVEEPPTPSPA